MPHEASTDGSCEIRCAACGSTDVSTKTISEEFEYGSGPAPARIRVEIPVHRCASCETEYTDSAAEDIRHEAICQYLGVLSPKEILALRSSRGLSRQRFADITRIGSATLARWESGEIIQNAAMDNYMRLISRQEIFELIKSGAVAQPEQTSETVTMKERSALRFPTLCASGDISREIQRAQNFKLAIAG